MPGFIARFARTWIVGCTGVAALLLQAPPPDLLARLQQATGLSPLEVRFLGLLNPLVLVTVMALVGAGLAHRVGLRSAIAGTAPQWPGASSLAAAIGLGLLVSVFVLAADAALAPHLGAAWGELRADVADAAGAEALSVGVLYGGLAEEMMLRWGLMSFVLFVIAKAAGARLDGTAARAAVAWPAIVVAALAFGAAHLPAVAQGTELTPALAARTLVLNAVAGLVYGWLYWRDGLEAAIASHAASHVGFAAARAFG